MQESVIWAKREKQHQICLYVYKHLIKNPE